MMKGRTMCMVLATLAGAACASATVVHFDDLQIHTPLGGVSYMGITFGTSTTNTQGGNLGEFETLDDVNYANAHSPGNYVYNAWGADLLSMTFDGGPQDFDGAWLAIPTADLVWPKASMLRFRDDLGQTSAWLTPTTTMQYLSFGHTGSSVIYVETDGDGPRQYVMDDVTYNAPVPEPASVSLAALALGAAVRRRIKKTA